MMRNATRAVFSQLEAQTLLRQIAELGQLGAEDGAGGRTRLALTDADQAARDRLAGWMRELDLEVRIDRIGNMFAILRSDPDDALREPLMIGSHIDTVRNAGALDGCYGVLAGLAVARAFRKAGAQPDRSVVIAAFTNEEGVRYQPDMMGSLVHAGGLSVESALDTVGQDGTRLGDELARIGYAGDLQPGTIRPREYLELHIEQGPVLEAERTLIGAVENLQGISWQQITVEGQANHAGTTPMRLRHDAGWVAAAVTTFVRELATSTATTLATVGMMRIEPDVINVIPRKAVFTVDLRDPDEQRLQQAEQRLADFVATLAGKEGVKIASQRLARFEPVTFDAQLVDEIAASAKRLGLTHRRMTSGAGHDAQMIARIAPAAMIFVPSRGGVSHNPREHTDDEQLIAGVQVLLDVALGRVGVKG